jgi:hypothetical protein
VEPSGDGLTATYFNIKKSKLEQVLTRVDPIVDFNWGTGSPAAGVNADKFFVRWSGQVKPAHSQTYTFFTVTEGGTKLWVNGVLLIDKKSEKGIKENKGTISLVAGTKYDIVMEYTKDKSNAVARLLWASQSQTKQVIPQIRLFSIAPAPGIAKARNAVENFTQEERTVSLFPNPVADGDVSINLVGFSQEQQIMLAITDITGRTVYSKNIDINKLNNRTTTIKGSYFASGIYVLHISTAISLHTLKFVVQH